MIARTLLPLLLATGCAQKAATPPSPEPAVTAATPPAEPDAPAPWSDLANRLKARHAEDLPDAQALAAIEGVDEGLVWLASNHDMMMVRARALEALGKVATPLALATLQATAADTSIHGMLRSAAVIGMGHLPLADHAELLDTLAILGVDTDTRVAAEAATVLRRTPAAEAHVTQLLAHEGLDATVRTILTE